MAGCLDLVVHHPLDVDGRRRVREVVAVPGRVEEDVVETADIFTTRSGQLVRADEFPPHPDRFERIGVDVATLLTRPESGGLDVAGPGLGLLLGTGLFLVWWSCWTPTPRHVRARSGLVLRLHDELQQADMGSVGLRAMLLTCIVAGTVVALVVGIVSAAPAIALCFGAIAAWTPVALVRARARRRRTLVRDLWPEAVDRLTSGTRAGLSLPESLSQLGERGPVELRPAFREFAEDYRATGAFSPCLELLKQRLADPVADRIVEALKVTREVGGQ